MSSFILGIYFGGMITYLMLAIDVGDFSLNFFLEASIWPISFIETIIRRMKGE